MGLTDGARAAEHAVGETWDAIAGLYDAYRVEAGKADEQPMPAWADLPEAKKSLFILLFAPHMRAGMTLAQTVSRA